MKFYQETDPTSKNICFKRLRNVGKSSIHCPGVYVILKMKHLGILFNNTRKFTRLRQVFSFSQDESKPAKPISTI